MKRDNLIFDLIDKEKHRQESGLELIASENFVSPQVMQATGSVLTNKYAEGLPRKRYYGGCEVVDEIEQIAINRAKELFGAVWANVQSHSGAQANAAVMLAILKPGDKILGFDLAHGGHLTHGSPVNFSGKLYKTSFYGVSQETGTIDYDAMEETARKEKPQLIITGASAYSRDWDYERFRVVADEIGAILMADISHPAGLIARGLLNDPLEFCHIITTTTHKTLRGPRGGMILMREDFENPFGIKNFKGSLKKVSELLDSAVFPGTQGGPLEHIITAKAIGFGEALTDEYMEYVMQVQKNGKAMSQGFVDKGYGVISGGTDNHLFLIDLRSKKLTGKIAENALVKADITVNKNMVPFDDKSPFVTSGIRIGTSAITTRGMKEFDMVKIVHLIDEVLSNYENGETIRSIKKEVNKWMESFSLYSK